MSLALTPEEFFIESTVERRLRARRWGNVYAVMPPTPRFEVAAAHAILVARETRACVECGAPLPADRLQVCSTRHSLRFNKRLAARRKTYYRQMAHLLREARYLSQVWPTANDLVNEELRARRNGA